MTPQTEKTLLYIVIFGGIAAGGYLLYKNSTDKNSSSNNNNTGIAKTDKVVGILSNSGGQGDYNFLMSLSDAYINDWYNAVKNRQSTFTSGGGRFDTVTGKAVNAAGQVV